MCRQCGQCGFEGKLVSLAGVVLGSRTLSLVRRVRLFVRLSLFPRPVVSVSFTGVCCGGNVYVILFMGPVWVSPGFWERRCFGVSRPGPCACPGSGLRKRFKVCACGVVARSRHCWAWQELMWEG